MATLSLTVASCDFCSSDRRFASTFLQIPLALIMIIAMNRTPLVLAVSFPLLGRIGDFHPLETCAARRTTKAVYSSQNKRLPALYNFNAFLYSLENFLILYCNRCEYQQMPCLQISFCLQPYLHILSPVLYLIQFQLALLH